jgi:receptor protein-tyrosine kinase
VTLVSRRERKQKKQPKNKKVVESQLESVPVDDAVLEREVAAGGLAIRERDGALIHVTPPDVANSLRYLVARLQHTDSVTDRQSIAVTSALEGEGVTSIARGLAAIIAHDLDRSVCLVEANWWTPADEPRDANWWIENDLAPPNTRPGLAEVLRGSSSVENALVRTTDDRLSMLPSGRLPIAHRAATAASAGFTDVMELLDKLFDAVVIDAPPVLKAAEATTIVRHADSTVLVVRQGVTTERQVETAIDELAGTELLGVIMNRVETRVPRFLQRFTTPT